MRELDEMLSDIAAVRFFIEAGNTQAALIYLDGMHAKYSERADARPLAKVIALVPKGASNRA